MEIQNFTSTKSVSQALLSAIDENIITDAQDLARLLFVLTDLEGTDLQKFMLKLALHWVESEEEGYHLDMLIESASEAV